MPDHSPIAMSVAATAETFDERAYLAQNGDVAQAVAAGMFASGRDHFAKVGCAEGRRQRAGAANDDARRRKLERLNPFLRPDMPFRIDDGRLDFLSRRTREELRKADRGNVSANPYDPEMHRIIEAHGDGLILDCGAGLRDVYFHNVVNFEIAPYDSTDVIGVGEELPFQSNTFDAVFSIAVLEHVRDPFQCAAEIARVLKPGGELYCCIPFLQPLHGYPDHYFNATPQGARRLFEDRLRIDSVDVPDALHPIWALSWILNSWSAGLDEPTREAFLNLQVKDLTASPHGLLRHACVRALSSEKRFELAAGTVLRGVKERSDPEMGAGKGWSGQRALKRLRRLFS